MESNNITIVVSECGYCGGYLTVASARIEDGSGVVEVVCDSCGKVDTVTVTPKEVTL